MKILALACCVCSLGFAQEFKVSTTTFTADGFSKESTPVVAGIQLRDIKKRPLELTTRGLTLVQYWSRCCGGEADVWATARDMEARYKKAGLTTYSINFENGTTFFEQYDQVMAFLKGKEMPENLYFDFMGYANDDLKISGFPTYLLVSPEGNIVFRAKVKEDKALAALEEEIEMWLDRISRQAEAPKINMK